MTGATWAALALFAQLAACSVGPWRVGEPQVRPFDADVSSWQPAGRPAPSRHVRLTIALRLDEGRRSELERVFWEVSDPSHVKYGKHLSLAGVAELLAVPEEQVQRVRQHFLAAGADSVEVAPARDLMTMTMPVDKAEVALRTTLHIFTHRERPEVHIIRAITTYSLPVSIAGDVAMVGELLQFPRLRPLALRHLTVGRGSWPNDCDAARCKGLVTPGVLAKRYKIPTDEGGSNGTSMAVAEFQPEDFQTSDLEMFGSRCNRDVKVDHVVGPHSEDPGVEAELDIEYIKAVAPGAALTVVSGGDYSLLQWANTITSMPSPPLVHSVSYGNDEGQQSSTEYMQTCNTQFMKAGVMGLSILFASGDQGACGREGCGIFNFHFHPDFPAASPYITAVGGTDFVTNEIGEEMSWAASGGGFSDTFGIPAYQRSAVDAYKAAPDANLPPQEYWNGTGRGYPDVSALGGQKAPYCIKSGLLFHGVAGTSASAPVVAGVVARLNALRQRHSMKPMGFLNPFIYANPQAFQDVTKGNNDYGRRYGFSAIKGWDAATGMGTPDFDALSKAALVTVDRAVLLV